MKLLVTGAAGFIGSHLAARALDLGHDVVGLDAYDETLYDRAGHETNARTLLGRPRFRLVEGDVLDPRLVGDLVRGVDVVVHLAALAGVRPSLGQPARYARVNVEGTTNVFEACATAGVRRVVFASSSSVYGERTDVPFREDDPALAPASPYAATKRMGELLASTYRDRHGLGITSLRFFTVYGPRQRPEMAIASFARKILAGRPITLYGDGTSARDYTYVDDILDGVWAAAERVTPGALAVYNLGGSRTTTLVRLVELLGAALGRTPVVEWAPDQPGDVPVTCADLRRAGAELGYAPKVAIEDGLARVAAWLAAGG